MDFQGEYFEDYADGIWQWLTSPNAGFAGEHVVVTGAFSDYTRPELEELLREQGATIQKSVNGKTTLLVVGSKPGADKTSKAEALGVRTMEEEEVLELLAEANG
jgi:NAD-dependent DNA ligase